MDISTMHTAVKLGLDKSSALDIPAFEPEEIDFWLNQAIRDFVKTRYSGVNMKQESFEQTQKRTDDLRTLVTSTDIVLTVVAGSNRYTGQLGIVGNVADYWFAIREEATITVGTVEKRVGVTQCTQDRYRQMLDDPYSEHILHYGSAKPLRLFYGDNIELTTDGNYTADTYHLMYIKTPAEVDLTGATDCDLPEHTHDEIVRLTVNILLENIEQPRLKTHSEFVATME